MKKIFTRKLCTYMIIGLAAAVIVIFMLQAITTNIRNTYDSQEKLVAGILPLLQARTS